MTSHQRSHHVEHHTDRKPRSARAMHRRAVSFRTQLQMAQHQKCLSTVRSSGWPRHAATPKYDILIDAGPKTAKPDHTVCEESPLNRTLMEVFRRTLAEVAGGDDSPLEGWATHLSICSFMDPVPRFDGIVDLTRRLNDPRINTPTETREKAAAVLRALFPVWFTAAVNV